MKIKLENQKNTLDISLLIVSPLISGHFTNYFMKACEAEFNSPNSRVIKYDKTKSAIQ